MYNIGEQEQSRRGMSSAVQILSVNRESCKKAMGTDYFYMAITIQKQSNGSLIFQSLQQNDVTMNRIKLNPIGNKTQQCMS